MFNNPLLQRAKCIFEDAKNKKQNNKQTNNNNDFNFFRPSDLEIPVFVVCPPLNLDTKIANNIWMQKLEDRNVDLEKALGEWLDLYEILTGEGLVITLPPKKGYQDQCFVNCFVLLHHLYHQKENKKYIAILSNFTAEGRQGEEDIAEYILKIMSYECYKAPFKIEGPDLKYIPGTNIYIAGYGVRTQIETLEWLEDIFNCKIIKVNMNVGELGQYLYHFDCWCFPIAKKTVLLNTQSIDMKIVKEIEKNGIEIIPVDNDLCLSGITNSIRCGYMILNATNIDSLTSNTETYKMEKRKNETLEKICSKLGLELVLIDFSEFLKSGALASCCVERLNFVDF